MGSCVKSFLSYKFDRPERIHVCDQPIMNLAGQRVRRLWKLFRALVYLHVRVNQSIDKALI